VLFEVTHRTRYRFDREVFLEPHVLRLRPRCDASQQLLSYRLAVTPEPAGVSEGLDAEGNSIACAWFDGRTRSLDIAVAFTARATRTNPFAYLVTDPGTARLPATYPGGVEPVLAAYRAAQGGVAVVALAEDLRRESGGETLGFLAALTAHLHRECDVVVRETGDPWPAERTWAEKRGSCRDLAVLFTAACRAVGLAARFVSGYQEGDRVQERRYLHAWSEVYLPGGGWRGYDPTHGLAVADRHLAIAASRDPSGAAPVTGTFRGTDAAAALEYELEIRTEPDEAAASG